MRLSPSRPAPRAASPLLTLPTALLAGIAVLGVVDAVEEPRHLSVKRMGAVANSALADNLPTHDVASDYVYDEAGVVPITLSGTSASSTGAGVQISGSTVTITQAGTYRLSGSLRDGQVVVDADGDAVVRLVLDGAELSSSTTAPLVVEDAGKAVVLLAAGTTNTLTDATTYVYPEGEDEPDAALFSRADLSIGGTGSLTVEGRAADGIGAKDGLVIASGRITVRAVDEGIKGKDYLVVKGGTIGVTTTAGDGLRSTEKEDPTAGYVAIQGGTTTVTAAGDGVDAATDVVTTGGTLTVTSGGGAGATVAEGDSAKGLKAKAALVIGGGTVEVDAADDGLHADGDATVEEGTVRIASGDDGIKAEGTTSIHGGTTTVTRANEGVEGLKVRISGGTLTVTARDDAVNAAEEGVNEFSVAPNADITVTGGAITVDGGTDGFDSNGTLTFAGGSIVTLGSATTGLGEGAIDSNGALAFHGGIVASAGISSTTATPSNLSTRTFVQYTWSGNQSANTVVHLGTTSGQQLASFRVTKAFRSVLFSLPSLTLGTTYNVYTGGNLSGTANGSVYTGGTTAGANLAGTAVAGQVRNPSPWGGGGTVITVPTSTVTPTFTTTTSRTSTTTTTTRPTTTTTTTRPVTTTTTTTTRPTTTTTTTTSGGTGTAACTASYALAGSWPGGFQGAVTVTANRPLTSWRVTWTFANGQTVTQSWGATVTQTGSTVTASNAPWNGTLSAGATASMGFLGSWTSGNTAPTVTCTGS